MIELLSGIALGRVLPGQWAEVSLCLSKSPSRMCPGSFHQLRGTQTQQMWSPSLFCHPLWLVCPEPCGPSSSSLGSRGASCGHTGTQSFPSLHRSCSPGSAPASPASLPLGRLIRSPGVPKERGVWGSGGDRGLEFSRRRKGQTSFFPPLLSLVLVT